MAVGDKNALLVRVFDTLIATELTQRSDSDLRTGAAAGTCVDRLIALVRPFVALFTGSPDLARSYTSILASGTHASPLFTDLAAQLIEEFGTVISMHGCTAQPDAPATARALYFAYIGTLFHESAGGSVDPTVITESLRATFTAICSCTE
jgi:hypothetical protein